MNFETLVNLVAGGIGGTAGAVITCPLEVVKTRLQSSSTLINPTSVNYKPSGNGEGCSSTSSTCSPAVQCPTNATNVHKKACFDYPSARKKPIFVFSTANELVAGSEANSAPVKPVLTPDGSLSRPTTSNRILPATNNLCQTPQETISTGGGTGSGGGGGIRRHVSTFNAVNLVNTTKTSSKNSAQRFMLDAKKLCLSMPSTSGANKFGTNDLRHMGLFKHLRWIIKNEGFRALWRGLGPTLIGVAPSRALYFCAYSKAKSNLNEVFVPETPIVHVCSAAFAGFCSSTMTNPIWLIRTRLQLDRSIGHNKLTVFRCVKKIYNQNGLLGFYKGVTASYVGISETVIHFVIYEYLKSSTTPANNNERKYSHFLQYMMCAGISRLIATTTAYPHEVLRTRLREEGAKYRSLVQSLLLIVKEETWRGMYSGLSVHLLRSIPNTAVTMATYELVVYLLLEYL